MHELGTVFYVIQEVEKVVEENHLTQVASVTLEVGEVSGIIPYYLTDCWKWAVEKSQYLKGAELKIHRHLPGLHLLPARPVLEPPPHRPAPG